MPTLDENIAAIRRRLRNPLPDSPSDPQLMQLLIDEVMNQQAELGNTRNHYSVDSTPVTVSAGIEDYDIQGANFGRPFLIYTVDDTDQYHHRREVPILLMQDADRVYDGPQRTYSTYKHTAEVMVFYRQFENWKMRPVPIPGGSGTYQVWFETLYEYGSPEDSVGLPGFQNLLRVRTAISALPFCAWHNMSLLDNPRAWEMQVKALRDSLLLDEARFARQFASYRAQASKEGIHSKIPWGSAMDGDDLSAGTMASGWGF